MLLDVVSPSSYLTFNVNIAHVIGLVNAVYCSELLEIYNKARRKGKLDENNFFIVNRDYVRVRTSIKQDDQYACDASLSSIGIVTTYREGSKTFPDKICFDVEQFLKIIAEDDSKVLDTIAKKISLPSNEQETNELKKAKIKQKLKKAINVESLSVREALEDWIDVVFGKQNITIDTIKNFQKLLIDYCDKDMSKAIGIIDRAKSLTSIDCKEVIKGYEEAQELIRKSRKRNQKIATRNNLSDKQF